MERNLRARIASYLSSHKRRKAGYWLLFSLGAIVVFCTTYALILPAITISNELICGMEAHTHDESCWSLVDLPPEPEIVCGDWREADVVFHTHDSLCYNGEGALICPLEERERHVHGEECFVQQRTLVCGKTAGEADPEGAPSGGEAGEAARTYVRHAHTHTDACYSYQRGELTCLLEETPGHAHTDECYIEQPTGEWVLTCPLPGVDTPPVDPETGLSDPSVHVHGSECYEAMVQRVLGCGQEEAPGHTHTDDCYQWEQVLTCPEPEESEVLPEDVLPAAPAEEAPVHVHTDACYEITEVQVCNEEELELHVHTPACYEVLQVEDGMGGFEPREVLTCQLPVVVEHQHTQDCILQGEGEDREVMVRTCGMTVHVHTDECYVETGPDPDPYFCGLSEHFHTSECYFESGELRCSIPEHQHSEECLDPENFPDPEYPMEVPGAGANPEDPENPGEVPGNPEDPSNPGGPLEEELAPVQINESCEYTSDQFVMTFHVDGIALPVPEEGGGSRPEARPPVTEGEITDYRPATPPESGDTQPVMPPESGDTQPVMPPEGEETQPVPEVLPESPEEVLPSPEEDLVLPEEGGLPSGAETARRRRGRTLSLGEAAGPEEIPGEAEDGTPAAGETAGDAGDAGAAPWDGGLENDSPDMDPWEDSPSADGGDIPAPADPPEDQPEGSSQVEFQITEITEGEEYDALLARMMESVEEDALIAPPQVMEITATLGGRKLDLTGCTITVEVRPTQQLAEAVSNDNLSTMDLETEGLPEEGATPGMALTVLSAGSEEPVVKIYDGDEEDPEPLRLSLTAHNGRMMYSAAPTFVVNPRFKVQFYINIEEPLSEEKKPGVDEKLYLPFIDTSGAGNGGMGAVLPVNGNLNLPTKYLQLDGNGVVQYNRSLKELYKEEDREFNPELEEKLNVDFLNSLRNNQNYDLTEVWILKPGADPKSTSREDWDIKTGSLTDLNGRIKFTNEQESADTDATGDTILISQEEDTVVRLVYVAGSKLNAFASDATFYDYDVSDGTFKTVKDTSGKDNKVIDARSAGINSTENCAQEDKLAFGNKNINTNYGTKYGNQADNNNFGGCTFGLAAPTLDADGNIQLTVSAPDLFTDTAQAGKTRVEEVNRLMFNRRGDTYTLSSAGSTAINLENFGFQRDNWNKTKKIWSNNFWPVDAASTWGAAGHDIKFGSTANEATNRFTNAKGEMDGTLPVSDDGVDHNPYFGMKFAVDFQLTPEYIGPLEYYFYGDDDLWVYLTDLDTGESKLICDIGGVHSSVGEYVDMWDYIPGGKDGHGFGNYRLSVFYTERGASGSTCWMQFTVPEISEVKNDPYDPGKASLKIKKRVQSTTLEELDQEFRFRLLLTGLKNRYQMNFYGLDENGETQLLRSDTVSNKQVEFTLKHNQWVEVVSLSPGVQYEVEELFQSGNCHTSVSGAETVTKDVLAEGTVTDETTEVVYTNSFLYSLPETGGPGSGLYTVGGTLLLLAAGSLLYSMKSRRRGAVEKR